jgi:hypothetical protein
MIKMCVFFNKKKVCSQLSFCNKYQYSTVLAYFSSVAELHHFDAAQAPGKNFDAAPTLVGTLIYYSI